MALNRQYEVVLMGATGYTGKLCAEYITKAFPTDLKWAIAGRNAKKLETIVDDLKKINSDRTPPAIEIAELKKEDLDPLTKKAQLLITTVGPYNLYGTAAFEACAQNGTHYVDCTGEVPWYLDMLDKYEATAKKSGAIMIPQAGIDSVPPDVLSWLVAKCLRENIGKGTGEVINVLEDIKGGVSGGTLKTIFTIMDTYSLSHLGRSRKAHCISPTPAPQGLPSSHPTLFSKIFGVRSHPQLGVLTDTPQAVSNIPYVNRSWGLLPEHYGPRFLFTDWMKARSLLRGILWHFTMLTGGLMLLLKPFRMIMKKLVTQPGSGPDQALSHKAGVRYRAIGYADEPAKRRAEAIFSRNGIEMYGLTAVLMCETARVILRGQDTPAHKMRGVVTTATLGDQYIDRLRDAGIELEAKMLDS